MDGSHHQHPSCRHGPRLRLGRIHQAKHLSEYQMQMGGLYVAASNLTATLTFAFLSNKCF